MNTYLPPSPPWRTFRDVLNLNLSLSSSSRSATAFRKNLAPWHWVLPESAVLCNPRRDVVHMTQDSWINQSINQPINNQASVLLATRTALIGGRKEKQTMPELTRVPGGARPTLSSDDCAGWVPMLVLHVWYVCVCVSLWLCSGGSISSSSSSRCSRLC